MKWLLSLTLASCLRAGVGSQLQACGSALTDILSLVCRNQFHAPTKRTNVPSTLVNDIDVLTRYKRSRQFAVAQKRGGVVEECCFSSCSYENLLLYCSQSVDPLDVFTTARIGSSTTAQRPMTTTFIPTTATTPLSVLTVDHKPEDQAELDEKAAAAAAWALSRRWFYVNRLGRFRGQVGRRIINM